MANNSIRFTVKVEDRGELWSSIKRKVESLKTKDVAVSAGLYSLVGNSTDPNTNIAYRGIIQEFGTANGHIPSRSFIRTAFDENIEKIFNKSAKSFRKNLMSGTDYSMMLSDIGSTMEKIIKNRISDSSKYQPLAPETIRKRKRKRAYNNNLRFLERMAFSEATGLSLSGNEKSSKNKKTKKVAGPQGMKAIERPLLDSREMYNSVTYKIGKGWMK